MIADPAPRNGSSDADPDVSGGVAVRVVDSTVGVSLSELPPAVEVPVLPPGTVFAERFVLGETLGRGAYGVVYRAFDRRVRREVALKVLRADRHDPVSTRRFQREATIARDVDSPHLVRIFDTGESDGMLYLVGELLTGGTLRDRMASGPLAVEEVVRIAGQLLDGLAALHECGLVHRDVKPSNVLFDERGVAKLGDFGLATWHQGDLTRSLDTQHIVGTLAYLSPEQALGEPVVPASDLYALGVVLFEALTGTLPFPNSDSVGALLGRLGRPAPPLRRVRPDLPPWLCRLVDRLLARRQKDRYASALVARRDLDRRRVTAGWPPGLREVPRWVVALVAVVVALTAGGWSWHHRETRFAHLRAVEDERGRGVQAVDRGGRVLWERRGRDQFPPHVAALVRIAGIDRPVLAAFVHDPRRDYDPEHYRRLSLLDPQTGAVLRQVLLVRGNLPDYYLRDQPDRFSPAWLHAVDLDGDRRDEVLVGFNHMPSWPSFTVLWEPAIDRARLVLAAAGHMGLAGIVDLDGDERPELLFVGYNSVLGRYPSLLAYRFRVSPGEAPERSTYQFLPTFSPGLGEYQRDEQLPLWTRLLPRGEVPTGPASPGALTIDRAAERIVVRYDGLERPVELTFSGGSPSDPLPPRAAAVARLETFRAIEEVERLSGLGDWAAAVEAAVAARDHAARVEDAVLAEVAARFHASALIGAGWPVEAERVLAELVRDAWAASEAAFTAATAYHLAGDLAAAERWYRRGLGPGGQLGPGSRQRIYFLEGIFFALAEQGRFADAIREAERYAQVLGDPDRAAYYRALAQAFLGLPVPERLLVQPPDPWEIDSVRWGALEMRWRAAGPSEQLLADVRAELATTYEARGAVRLLEAELLAASGHLDEAREAAGLGASELAALRRAEPVSRSLAILLAPRFAQLGVEVAVE
jgi:tRNA A-37 threonylcarbamoyl transferase component Bud32